MTPRVTQLRAAGTSPASGWPKALRRGPMETLATVLIAAGVLMLLQPFSLTLYGYSFVTTLVGVVMFTFVTKFPE